MVSVRIRMSILLVFIIFAEVFRLRQNFLFILRLRLVQDGLGLGWLMKVCFTENVFRGFS